LQCFIAMKICATLLITIHALEDQSMVDCTFNEEVSNCKQRRF
jgi:hypothetical protein